MKITATLVAAGSVRLSFETPKGTRKAMARFTDQGDWSVRLSGKHLGFAESIEAAEKLVSRYVENIRDQQTKAALSKAWFSTPDEERMGSPSPEVIAGYTSSIHSTDGKLGQKTNNTRFSLSRSRFSETYHLLPWPTGEQYPHQPALCGQTDLDSLPAEDTPGNRAGIALCPRCAEKKKEATR